jgi:hypothetical protein
LPAQLRALAGRALRVNRLSAGVVRLGWLWVGQKAQLFALCERPRPTPGRLVLKLVHVDGPPLGGYAKSAHLLRWQSVRDQARLEGVFDLLLVRRGCLTETARFSLFLEIDGQLCTAPDREVYDGVARRSLLSGFPKPARVMRLTLTDLRRASRIILVNSVRGALEVHQVVNANGVEVWPRATCGKAEGLGQERGPHLPAGGPTRVGGTANGRSGVENRIGLHTRAHRYIKERGEEGRSGEPGCGSDTPLPIMV